MTWYWWVVLGVVLVAVGAGALGLLAWSLWGRAKALMTELGRASERFAAVSAQLEAVAERAPDADPAVFTDPTRLRQERLLAQRRRAREQRPG